MYKLENNVGWTEDLKNAFKHNITRAKIVYDIGGQEIIIDENNGIKEIVLEDNRYVPETGFIGQAVAKKLTATLLDNGQTINLENKEFTLYIGADYEEETYYINYGNFIVNEPPENDSTNGTIKIIAYDYMIKFNKDYVDTITYPCTLKNYLLNICNQAGVEFGSEGFVNDDFSVVNNQFEGKQLREILQHIGKCAFSWARIGQDNKLYLDFQVNDNNAIVETITTNDYKQDAYKRANEYYGPINKVTYGDSDIKGQEESVEDQQSIIQNGEKEIVINDNYFAYTAAKRRQLIQSGINLFGLEYMPISQLDLIGFVYLDCNDLILVQDTEGNTISSRVFAHTIKYNGAVSDSIEVEGPSENEDSYKNKNKTTNTTSRTEIMVDRANKKMQSVVETVSEQNTKISTLTQTVDELNSKISDTTDVTVHGESTFGTVELDGINQSEPITIKIYPIDESIYCLHPMNTLYPSDETYLHSRTLRFTNTTNGVVVDYELPDDLLIYDSEHYDEFYLDYSDYINRTCKVIKRCGLNADGTVYALSGEVEQTYTYPTIPLTTGNYTISLEGYNGAYLFVRLMASNIYTTQFATKVELSSEISQTAENINLSVNRKLTNYSTTTQMNSAISLKANEITSTVSQTYATKTTTNTLSSRIKQTAKSIELVTTDNSTSAGITIRLKNEDGTQIDSKSANITLSGLVKFTDLSNSGSTTINGSNITTGQINASLITTGTLSANRLNGGTISGTSINLGNGNFTVTSAGALTAKSGKIAGYTINGNMLVGTNVGMSGKSGEGWAFWAGSNDASAAPFRVGHNGALYATNAHISGTVSATSGTFDNCTVRSTCSVPASTVTGKLSSSNIPQLNASWIEGGVLHVDSSISNEMWTNTINGSAPYEDYYVVYNDGEKGWRRLTFRSGILVNVQDRW